MTDSLFFDTDCLSAFLWVGNQNLLIRLYPGKVVIPMQVYNELSYPGISHLKARVDTLLCNGQITLASIDTGTDAYDLYYTLTEVPLDGHVIIGKGEAASIVLAQIYDGTVASNNLRDINQYIEEFGLNHITTGDILMEAYRRRYITEDQGNSIWASMLAKRRKLGAMSFSEYMNACDGKQ